MKKLLIIIFTFAILFGISSNKTYSVTGYNAVVEYCTGTWCGYCPCGEVILQGIKQNYPNTMVLGYHGPTNSGDPWATPSAPMISLFGFNAYPTGIVNRTTGIIDRGGWNNAVVISSNTIQPGVSVAINNWNYNSSTHTITANVVSTALSNLTGTYYIMMVLTEDNLVYQQNYYAACNGNGYQTITHMWVVKGLVNGANGTILNTSDNWTQGNAVTTPLNYMFPAGVVDANCNLNVFVYLYTGGNPSSGSQIQQSTYVSAVNGPTGIISQNNNVPKEYSISQNYPNPFNPTTNIHFSIPKDGNVSLKFYDMLGQEVAVFADGFMKAGTYNAEFDGSNFASGIYFYTLKAGNFIETKKMSLVK